MAYVSQLLELSENEIPTSQQSYWMAGLQVLSTFNCNQLQLK